MSFMKIIKNIFGKTIAVSLLGILVSGCAKESDFRKLEKDIGCFRYLNETPKISVKILNKKLNKTEEKYSSAHTLTLTGVITQRETFPVEKYSTFISLNIKLQGKMVANAYVKTTLSNSEPSAAFSEDVLIYGLDKDQNYDDSMTVDIGQFSWSPEKDWMPFVKIEEGSH